MGNWWDGLVAPFAPAPISGYNFGDKVPPGGWTGNGSDYGWPVHLGTDFGTKAGEAIVSPGAGTVTYKTGQYGYGNELIDQLSNGFTFIFGHVAAGAAGKVAAGQRIGTTGADVGSAKGSVTLVEVLDPSGRPINPDPFLGDIWAKIHDAGHRAANDAFGLAGGLPSGGMNDFNPQTPDPFGIGQLGQSIAGIPTTIGHGLADFFVVGEQDIAEWLKRQSVAFFVAAVVLLVLFL